MCTGPIRTLEVKQTSSPPWAKKSGGKLRKPWSRRRKNPKHTTETRHRPLPTGNFPPMSSFSLGIGSFPRGGSVTFAPSAAADKPVSRTSFTTQSVSDDEDDAVNRKKVQFLRKNSTFMRMADLGVDEDDLKSHIPSSSGEEVHPHFHHPSGLPPPGANKDPKESWIALDNGMGDHSPLAPQVVKSLAGYGLRLAWNQGMWNATKPTEKLLLKSAWANAVWNDTGRIPVPPKGSPEDKDVLIWSGSVGHDFYGGELPTVRAVGIVNMRPEAIFELLLDSDRVGEYNKMSLGRSDELILQNGIDKEGPFGKSVTKVVRSATKPPLVRKPLELVSLLHGRKLDCDGGFFIVSRAVTQAASAELDDGKSQRTEILMGLNIIRRVEGDDNRSVMINVNHVRSPMIPQMIAKKVGLGAASGFFGDLRALC